MFYTLSIACYY